MNGLRLTHEVADAIVRRTCATAAEQGALVSAAVVDAGGHLVAFARMDDAEFAGATIAIDKAYTAAGNRVATLELSSLVAPGADLAGYHSAAGGRFIAFGGGVPLWADGRIAGAVGVSGSTGTHDDQLARAGARAWSEAGGDRDG